MSDDPKKEDPLAAAPANAENTEEEDNEKVEDEAEPDSQYEKVNSRQTSDYVSSNTWVVSFTDIMALMLTFFVLLYSMSAPEVDKWEEMTSGFKSKLGGSSTESMNHGEQDSISINKVNFSKALDINYLNGIVNKLMEEEEILNGIVAVQDSGKLVISLPENKIFEDNSSKISLEGSKILYALSGKLYLIRNRIEVVGHMPLLPGKSTQEEEQAWQLSLERALATAAVLYKVGYKNQLTVKGYHDSSVSGIESDTEDKIVLLGAKRIDILVMEDDRKSSIMPEISIK